MEAKYADGFQIIRNPGMVRIIFEQIIPEIRRTGNELKVIGETPVDVSALLISESIALQLAQQLSALIGEDKGDETDPNILH